MAKKKKPELEKRYPLIDFCFSGWVRDAIIKEVTVTKTGEKISCENMKVEKLLRNLESGKWAISFTEAYEETSDTECELTEFDEGSDNDVWGTR